MRLSGPSSAAQWASRLWLLAAGGAALLPPETRQGWWLPLHLALAGGAGTAIAGAMPRFAASLAGRRDRPDPWAAPALLSVGTAAVALGRVLPIAWLLAVGGAAYGLGGAWLAGAVTASWREGTNRRHAPILALYVVAALAVVAGAAVGAILGTGATGGAFLSLRRAHVALNLWGFLGLTIAGSLVILVPVVLRTRAPDRRPWEIAAGLGGGLVLLAGGLAFDLRPLAVVGSALYTVGAAALAVRVVGAVVRGSRMPERAAALHLGSAATWLLGASASVLVALVTGHLDRLQLALIAAVGLGVALQALVGTWSYLLPVSSPGGAAARRRRLAITAFGGLPQWAVLNLGTAAVVLAAAGVLPGPGGSIGLAATVGAALFAMAKLPAPPPLERLP